MSKRENPPVAEHARVASQKPSCSAQKKNALMLKRGSSGLYAYTGPIPAGTEALGITRSDRYSEHEHVQRGKGA